MPICTDPRSVAVMDGALTATSDVLRRAGCVFADDEAALLVDAAANDRDLRERVARRCDGEPLEYVLGYASFAGHRVAVGPGAFIPRRRTELVVDVAIARTGDGARVLDLACGVGAIGLALASARTVTLTACDIDPGALSFAHANLRQLGAEIVAGDLFDALPESDYRSFDVIVFNGPYVPCDEIATLPREARLYEPHRALDGGADGLDLHRRVADELWRWLSPNGTLITECAAHQVPAVRELFVTRGWEGATVHDTDADAHVVVVTQPVRGRL